MKQAAHRQQNEGFTLVEMLAAVLILAILMGLAVVGVAWYRDHMKISELDNAARDIYMAAGNRAVFLAGDERMQKLALSGEKLALPDGTEGRVLQKSTPNLMRLLPTGSIDPALWDGDFYLVCDPDSGSVTDVFYGEEILSELITDEGGFAAFYENWSGRPQGDRMHASPMIGYYGGAATQGRSAEDTAAPQMYVEIQNEERLTLTVSYWLPSGLVETDAALEMKLLYGGGDSPEEHPLALDARQVKSDQKAGADGTIYTHTYVLDELKAEEGRGNPEALQFKDLLPAGVDPGKDFKVVAALRPADPDVPFEKTEAVSEENNSLFAKRDAADATTTATVSNLRHLQNLSTAFSGVKGITEAVQADHIACYENETYPQYAFRPIENDALVQYEGKEKQIRRLYITAAEGNAAGLFAQMKGAPTKPAHISGVYLLKADVQIPASKTVGAVGALLGSGDSLVVEECYLQESTVSGGTQLGGLAGNVSACAFKACRVTDTAVYTQAASALAGGVAGNVSGNSTFEDCRIQGSTVETADANAAAGGFAGKAVNPALPGEGEANATFRGCRAANVAVNPAVPVSMDTAGGSAYAGGIAGQTENVSFHGCQVFWEPEEGSTLRSLLGTDDETGYHYQITGTYAGGLVGDAQKDVRITDSLAASLVQGGTVGGLVGNGKTVTIQNAYADCFLRGTKKAAGLLGWMDSGATASLKLTNVYAAGFVDGAGTASALGGLANTHGTSYSENAYAAVLYENYTEQCTFTPGAVNTKTSPAVNCFYMKSAGPKIDSEDKQAIEYSQLTGRDNIESKGVYEMLGAAFEAKDIASSHPYNLRQNFFLTAYSFPGLKNLPHYGDWGARFSEPSLVYYEEYTWKDENGGEQRLYGFSGGNARYLNTLSDDYTIVKDGYAVAFLKNDVENLENGGTFKSVTFTYNTDPKAAAPSGTVIKQKNELLATAWRDPDSVSPKETEYYLLPLPDTLVQDMLAKKDDKGNDIRELAPVESLYQYLKIKIEYTIIGGTNKEQPGEKEYFYNPHFAETVLPCTKAQAENWQASAAEMAKTYNLLSIRTPRHLYNLSQAKAYYAHSGTPRLTFQQHLDLDYASYTGYSLFEKKTDGAFEQPPIGTWLNPFSGTYDGGCRTIQGVRYTYATQGQQAYAGLFGVSTGNLKNIVYCQPAYDKSEEKAPRFSFDGTLYAGTLLGVNRGSGWVDNCAVTDAHLLVNNFGGTDYIGGLVGQNQGFIYRSAAQVENILTDNTGFGDIRAGGFVGQNTGFISTSHAVARISMTGGTEAVSIACGFAGANLRAIENCYAAADLRIEGAKAKRFGFAAPGRGTQNGCTYLNNENYTYLDISYGAGYGDGIDPPAYTTYSKLSSADPQENPLLKNGMQRMDGEGVFPYPTAVKDAQGNPVHYGPWPTPIDLGEAGVYYWEKLEISGGARYAISLLAVQTEGGSYKVKQRQTLSNAHDDGGIVTDYGYGYYTARLKDQDGNLTDAEPAIGLQADGIYVYEPGGEGRLFVGESGSGDTKDASIEEVNKELAKTMEGYVFHSYYSYDPLVNRAGANCLYPVGIKDRKTGAETSPNGTITLKLDGAEVTFALNPHFADALAIQELTVNNRKQQVSGRTDAPGEEKNPYGVRSVAQLEMMNWNRVNRDTRTVVWAWDERGDDKKDDPKDIAHKRVNFPYLSESSTTGKYYWDQTHDLDGNHQTYTPIAEFYDRTSPDTDSAALGGWFGGTYKGNNYVIKNISIQGQQSSCAGLFGVVFEGKLCDMVLYDAAGSGQINAYNAGQLGTGTAWYAIGALAGLAAVDNQAKATESTVLNCSVAGYKINADICTAQKNKGSWGGAGVGGLIGICNMNLTNCSAVTSVDIPDSGSIRSNDNMRVGGLVGACQGTIRNCYAGGDITIGVNTTASDKGVYVGGIVGGSYMKPLKVNDNGTAKWIGKMWDADKGTGSEYGNTDNAFTNCYSYVNLPVANKENNIQSLYAIGGTGEIVTKDKDPNGRVRNHGSCTIQKCYYLKGVFGANKIETTDPWPYNNPTTTVSGQKTDLDNDELIGLTYDELSGRTDMPSPRSGKIFESQNWAAQTSGAFQPVTTTISGFEVAGRYSYPTKVELQGLNYPFPTILTREGLYVHYGDWPLGGIEREEGKAGGAPVNLDIFSERTYTEKLKLSSSLQTEPGIWSVKSADEKVADAAIDQNGNLTVKACNEGNAALTIQYTLSGNGGQTYTLNVRVNVTANLNMRPLELYIYQGDTLTVPVTPLGTKSDGTEQPLSTTGIKLTADSGSDSDLICAVPEPEEGEAPYIQMQAGEEAEAGAVKTVNVTLSYPHPDNVSAPDPGTGEQKTGILRAEGKGLVELSASSESDYTEQLSLSGEVSANGTWSVKSEKEDIAKAKINNQGSLSVTAVGIGQTKLTVTYMAGTQSYTLDIPVNITKMYEQVFPVQVHVLSVPKVTYEEPKEGGLEKGAYVLAFDSKAGEDVITSFTAEIQGADDYEITVQGTSAPSGTGQTGPFRLLIRGKNYDAWTAGGGQPPRPAMTVAANMQTASGQKHMLRMNLPPYEKDAIRRSKGDKPIELDLFASPISTETLSRVGEWKNKPGTWSVTCTATGASEGKEVAAAAIDEKSGKLTVTAGSEGEAELTITFTAEDGTSATLTVRVKVTASLNMTPAEVSVYPGDTLTVPVELYGAKPGDAVPAADMKLSVGNTTGNLTVEAPEPQAGETPHIRITAPPDATVGEGTVEIIVSCPYPGTETGETPEPQMYEKTFPMKVYVLAAPAYTDQYQPPTGTEEGAYVLEFPPAVGTDAIARLKAVITGEEANTYSIIPGANPFQLLIRPKDSGQWTTENQPPRPAITLAVEMQMENGQTHRLTLSLPPVTPEKPIPPVPEEPIQRGEGKDSSEPIVLTLPAEEAEATAYTEALFLSDALKEQTGTWGVESGDEAVATATIEAGTGSALLKANAVGEGETNLTITFLDAVGTSHSLNIPVTVTAAPQEPELPVPEEPGEEKPAPGGTTDGGISTGEGGGTGTDNSPDDTDVGQTPGIETGNTPAPGPEAGTEPDIKPEPDPTPEMESGTKPEPDPAPGTEPDTKPEPEPNPTPEMESGTKPDPEPNPTPETEPAPDPETDPPPAPAS